MLPEDPSILYSYINMKIRDSYDSLEALCDDLDISEFEIKEKLEKAGYHFNEQLQQFKI